MPGCFRAILTGLGCLVLIIAAPFIGFFIMTGAMIYNHHHPARPAIHHHAQRPEGAAATAERAFH